MCACRSCPGPTDTIADDDFNRCASKCANVGQESALRHSPMVAGQLFRQGMRFIWITPSWCERWRFCPRDGIEFKMPKCKGAERGPQGIAAMVLEDGRRLTADLYIDASGFRSELLGKTLEEPYISYEPRCSTTVQWSAVGSAGPTSRFCPTPPPKRWTPAGAGGIEHEQEINRGYVYSSIGHFR